MTPWTGPRDSPGQNTGMGSLPLFQGIFPTEGSNPGLYQAASLPAEPQGKPKSGYSPVGLSDPGIELGSPALQVDMSDHVTGFPSHLK